MATRRWKKNKDLFIRSDRMHKRNRHTDKHMDRHRMTAKERLHSIAWQNGYKTAEINVKNFHGSLTTVVGA